MPSAILVIEDDSDQSRPLVQMLRYRNYLILSAQNGMDGVAQAIKNRPDLVIVDLLLVERGDIMDGYDVIQAIRGTPEIANIGILAWTGHFVERTDEIRALRSGADDYVSKDVEFGVLEARIEALLRRTTRVKG